MNPRAWARELASLYPEHKRNRPAPPSGARVLDVGGGDKPHPRADLVIDKYVADNFERETDVSLSKPLIVADGERLPLADGSFDYVVASHVLEHAIDPSRFAAELCRVGRSGFVQVPSRLSELTFGWPFHPWLVDLDEGVLVFHSRNGQAAPCGEFFHGMYQRSPLLQMWFAAHESVWRHSVHWRGELPVRVEGRSQAAQTATFDLERSLSVLSAAHAAGRLAPMPDAVARLLRCPACREAVELRSDRAACTACERAYPAVGPIPVLLEEAAAA